jgi:hypothetical protein
MSKKKKDKIEEPPKKPKAVKAKPAKVETKKKNIVPASLPVLVQAKAPAAEAPVPPVEPAPVEVAAPKAKKAPAKKAPAKKKEKAAKPVIETVVVEEIIISNDDIALRAYFISQDRRSRGHWGDETGDWVEAERQLRAEAAEKKK